MYVCICLGVTDHEIKGIIADGASSMEEVASCTGGAGTRCGCCRSAIAAMLDDAEEDRPARRCLPVLSPAAA